jgi:hypothetical protein
MWVLMPGTSGTIFPIASFRLLEIPGSDWICAAKARHGRTQNPELTSLLLRCEKLAQMPLTARFVFDGPGRTSVKRGIQTCGAKIASQLAYLNYEQDLLRMAENGQDASHQMDE